MIKTKCVYDKKEPNDGKWILVMRKWPRGVAKTKIDEWHRELAPSEELLSDWKEKKIDWEKYEGRYLQEISKQKELTQTLTEKERMENITLVCSEKDNRYCYLRFLKVILLLLMGKDLVKELAEDMKRVGKKERSKPSYAEIYLSLGTLSVTLERYEIALECFDKAVRIKPDCAKAWSERGIALEGLNEREKAKESYDKAIELKPDLRDARVHRGIINLFKFHQYRDARKDIKKAKESASKQKSIQLKNFLSGIYFWASGMEFLSKRLVKETKRTFLEAASFFEKLEGQEMKDISDDLFLLAGVLEADLNFGKHLVGDLSLLKMGVEELLSYLKELDISKSSGIAINIIISKAFYFSALLKALNFEKVDLALLRLSRVEPLLRRLKFERCGETIGRCKDFIAKLDDWKRRKDIRSIEDIPIKEQIELVNLIRDSAYNMNGHLTVVTNEAYINARSVIVMTESLKQERPSSDVFLKTKEKEIFPKEKPKEPIGEVPPGEKAQYEEPIDLLNERYLYNLLGIEIDYVNREPIVTFKLWSKARTLKATKTIEEFRTSEKYFALFTRLAIAMKTNERDGWLQIKRDLLYKYQDIDKLRTFLGNCDIFTLTTKQKKKLIRTRKALGGTRLAIPGKVDDKSNITINIENLQSFKSRFSKSKKNGLKKATERIQKLIHDGCKRYIEFPPKKP